MQAGFARDDLFCVVHEIFQTDTADYADILLPATTQLEQLDIHSSYGHLYALANNPAIAPLGEAKPNTEVFRLLAARMGFTEPCFRDSDDDLARQAFMREPPARGGPRLGRAEGGRLPAPRRARPLCAVRGRQFPHAVGQVRVPLGRAGARRARSAADLRSAARIGGEQSGAGATLPAGVPLAARAQLPQFVVREPAELRRRGEDAAPRHPSGRRGLARDRNRRLACASSTIAGASRRRRASATARVRASSSRRRSGGRSSRRTARTPTTSPARR